MVSPFLGLMAFRAMMLASSVAHACILRYDSRPFSVSLSHDLGLDNSSLTVPCDRPSTCLANSRCPMLLMESSSRTVLATAAVSRPPGVDWALLVVLLSLALELEPPGAVPEGSPARPGTSPASALTMFSGRNAGWNGLPGKA